MININEKELWEEYFRKKETSIRNKIAENYMNLINYLIRRIKCDNILREELFNVGFLALIEAIEKFDCNKNVKFITYAYYKIHGRLIDYIRDFNFNSQYEINKIKKLNEALLSLREKDVINPTDEEIAIEMGFDNFNDFYKFFDGIKIRKIENYLDLLDVSSENYSITEYYKELIKNLLIIILDKELNDTEKKVIFLYYYEELTFKEIGYILDLTEARISQIHSVAISKIKLSLKSKMQIIV